LFPSPGSASWRKFKLKNNLGSKDSGLWLMSDVMMSDLIWRFGNFAISGLTMK